MPSLWTTQLNKDIKRITCWSREIDGVWKYGFFTEGWSLFRFKPKPKVVDSPAQLGWKNFKWKKEYKHLIDGVVV